MWARYPPGIPCTLNFCRERDTSYKLPVWLQVPKMAQHSPNTPCEHGKIRVIKESAEEQRTNTEFFCLVLSIPDTLWGWNMFCIHICKNRVSRFNYYTPIITLLHSVITLLHSTITWKMYLGKIGLNSLHCVVQGSPLAFEVWTAESGYLSSKLRKKSISLRSQQEGQGKSISSASNPVPAWLKPRICKQFLAADP